MIPTQQLFSWLVEDLERLADGLAAEPQDELTRARAGGVEDALTIARVWAVRAGATHEDSTVPRESGSGSGGSASFASQFPRAH